MLSMMVLSFVMQAMPMQSAEPVQISNDAVLAVATDPPKRPNVPGTTTPPVRPPHPPVSGPNTPKRPPHGPQQPGHHPGTGKGEPGPKKPKGNGP